MTVSVPFSAQPNQVLEAMRKIRDEAQRTGKELRNLGDIDFPGLEDARDTLLEMQKGFQQLGAKGVKGGAAEAIRVGGRSGLYDGGDIVSWLLHSHRQFPNEKDHQRHVNAVLAQAGRINSMPVPPPGSPGGAAPPAGGGPGSMLGSLAGLMPGGAVIKSVLGMLGVGAGLGFISKKIGDAADEAVAMTDLRRTVGALNMDFPTFRDQIRKAGDGLGVMYEETVRLSREYAKVAGSRGGDQTSSGTHEGIRLARMFGLQPGQGVGMMGRASWFQLGGTTDINRQARVLAEAMAGSGLGARQADAAEAMLRYTERASQTLSDGGDSGMLLRLFHSLTNSGIMGLRNNAENIIGGMDSAIKGGGNAGVAGQNFTWNMLARHGVNNPFQAEHLLEEGISGKAPDGTPVWKALMGGLKDRYPNDPMMRANAAKNYFGVSMHHWLDLEGKIGNGANQKDIGALIDKIEADLKKGNLGDQVREASANLSNQLTKLIGDSLIPLTTEMKDSLAGMLVGINDIADVMVPWRKGFSDIDPSTMDTIKGQADIAKRVMGNRDKTEYGGGHYSLIQDPDFMTSVNGLKEKYGIKINSTKFQVNDIDPVNGRMGIDSINGTAPSVKAIDEFSMAVMRFADTVKEGLSVNLTVAGESTQRGRVTKPSAR